MTSLRLLFRKAAALSLPAAVFLPLGGIKVPSPEPKATPAPAPSASVSPAYMVVTTGGAVVPLGGAANFGSFTQQPPASLPPPGTTETTTTTSPLSTSNPTTTVPGNTSNTPPSGAVPVTSAAAPATTVPPRGNGSGSTTPSGSGTGTSWNPIRAGSPVVTAAATGDSGGYWLVTVAGGVYTFGDAQFAGSLAGAHFAGKVVGFAPTHDSLGYWLATSVGGVFTFGDAAFYGSAGDLDPAHAPGGSNAAVLEDSIVAMVATPDAGGYWLVGSDGGVLTFGDARYYGSPYDMNPALPPGGSNSVEPLVAPIVGLASTSDGKGYWEAASDGGIFTFGDAAYYGSPYDLNPALPLGGSNSVEPLMAPIVGIAPSSDGNGYRLVASDGGIFTFGDASFSGSAVGAIASKDAAQVLVSDEPYVDGGSVAAREAAVFALSQVGQPYLYGGTGAGGYDCSGLVMVSYEHAGINLPRTAQEQYDATNPVPPGVPLLPGDLLFFGPATDAVTHVGIYIGNGMMVHAPHTGTFVTIESYQWDDYLGATRPAP